MALDMVLTSLEDQGYKTETFNIPASAVGSWHRRERIWIIAYDMRNGSGIYSTEKRRDVNAVNITFPKDSQSSNINCIGFENGQRTKKDISEGWQTPDRSKIPGYWTLYWAQVVPEFCRNNDGVPDRVDRIKSLGNAVLPQVVYEIFKAIEEYETI